MVESKAIGNEMEEIKSWTKQRDETHKFVTLCKDL